MDQPKDARFVAQPKRTPGSSLYKSEAALNSDPKAIHPCPDRVLGDIFGMGKAVKKAWERNPENTARMAPFIMSSNDRKLFTAMRTYIPGFRVENCPSFG
ncbi:uncharacterized protein DMAD_00818 [Drosophila madeirensis]|uniref:Uncharacterized protein n=1 Tax=Drosophila madeirensis TaxID=30013 RepID=A0AAU9FYT5_DROMD